MVSVGDGHATISRAEKVAQHIAIEGGPRTEQ